MHRPDPMDPAEPERPMPPYPPAPEEPGEAPHPNPVCGLRSHAHGAERLATRA